MNNIFVILICFFAGACISEAPASTYIGDHLKMPPDWNQIDAPPSVYFGPGAAIQILPAPSSKMTPQEHALEQWQMQKEACQEEETVSDKELCHKHNNLIEEKLAGVKVSVWSQDYGTSKFRESEAMIYFYGFAGEVETIYLRGEYQKQKVAIAHFISQMMAKEKK